MVIPSYTRSWIMMAPMGPSLIVATFNLYHLLANKALRTAINNHVIILLLCFGLLETVTDISWHVHYYRTGSAFIEASGFCYTWAYCGGALYISVFILMAWASIERHIIIFHPNLLATKRRYIMLHYFPLTVAIVWPAIFYSLMFFILPCGSTMNFNRRYCALYVPCISLNPWASLVDSIAHFILPAFVTVAFSLALLVRVIYVRYRIRGRVEWRNYRKMTLQLLPISGLYMIMQLPPMILYAAYSAGFPRTIAADYYNDGLFFTYWLIMLTPFVSVLSLPDLKTKCRNLIFFWRRSNAIQPTTLQATRRAIGQTIIGGATVK